MAQIRTDRDEELIQRLRLEDKKPRKFVNTTALGDGWVSRRPVDLPDLRRGADGDGEDD